MRIWVDKIASSTKNIDLRRDIRLSDRIIAREGQVVVGRIHREKTVYNQLEDVHGRMVVVHAGDVVAGVLGHRKALHGYSGYVPASVKVGDRLQLLNLGGVIGKCTSQNPDVGPPFDVEILGAALVFPDFEDRAGVAAHIGMNAISCGDGPMPEIPVVYVAGTCMNSGKTSAACRLIRQLATRGLRVGACKLTGVSLLRDAMQMADYGAKWALSFSDAGIATTDERNAVPTAQALMRHLTKQGAEVIVAELGDGILGEYGVAEILSDAKLIEIAAVIVMCATDPVSTWGAKQLMRERFKLQIDVVTGPATDNAVGTRFIQEQLALAAINARTHGAELGDFVAERVEKRLKRAVT